MGGAVKSQPNRNYQSDDRVMTPHALAVQLVAQVRPSGLILEPCAGNGNFVRALRPYGEVRWCEKDLGQDFFAWTTPVDWIVTNPPWSAFRAFLQHAIEVADHIAFMATVNHWWTSRRVALLQTAGFGYERLVLFERPDTFPPTGFQLGMMVISRGYGGPLQIESLSVLNERTGSTLDFNAVAGTVD